MKYYKKTIKGKNNNYLTEKAEIIEDEKFIFAGIASAKNDFLYGQYGAALVLQEVFSFIKEHYKEPSFELVEDKMQYEVGMKIRERLKKEAMRLDIPIDQLAYNFIAVALNKQEGTYFCIHLGDGEIYGRNPQGRIQKISAAEYGSTRIHRIFITEDGSLSHIRFLRGEAGYTEALYCFSKGGEKICRAMRKRSNHLNDPEYEEKMIVEDSMSWLNNREDASVVKLSVS